MIDLVLSSGLIELLEDCVFQEGHVLGQKHFVGLEHSKVDVQSVQHNYGQLQGCESPPPPVVKVQQLSQHSYNHKQQALHTVQVRLR